jgi:hypothetical protein
LTQVKFLGSYTVPRIDLQIASTFQSLPGAQLSAVYNAPFSNYGSSLGRFVSGGNANSVVPVNLVEPGTMFGDRLNQLDFRLGKIVRMGQMRMSLSLDLYNALNASTVLSESSAYAGSSITGWRRPTTILPARIAKFGAQLDF